MYFDFGPIAYKWSQITLLSRKFEQVPKLFNAMGGKLKFSAQESDLAPYNVTKVKIPSEIKPHLERDN